ncbi:MAG TPA: GNAT family N-acetyltransferase [Flavobacteriaceae bacterium]|nr:GNAT family N-acetyltransferase [Flavobacteriaceae bacterium]
MIKFKTYTAAKNLPEHWDTLNSHDVMLQKAYLRVLEKASPETIRCYFIAFFQDDKLVGTAIMQKAELYAKDMFRKNGASLWKQTLRKLLSLLLKGNILVLGNLMHTGQHGYSFDVASVKFSVFFEALIAAMEHLEKEIKNTTGKHIRLYLLKDFYETDNMVKNHSRLKELQFSKAWAQPNMVLDVSSGWNSTKAYVNDLVAKYRKRYKTARKKLKPTETRELDLEAITNESFVIYRLYKNVSDNAKFNTFILPENHFSELKKQMGDGFKLFGYYLNNELIGFYSLLLNAKTLETYFLGYDVKYQYRKQLYLNMLYDMLEYAVNRNYTQVVYARTAMEIKSSVGAKPVGMSMYLKHTNPLLNALLKPIFNVMSPKQKWEERNPFGK